MKIRIVWAHDIVVSFVSRWLSG